jgi:hypothetical protein
MVKRGNGGEIKGESGGMGGSPEWWLELARGGGNRCQCGAERR